MPQSILPGQQTVKFHVTTELELTPEMFHSGINKLVTLKGHCQCSGSERRWVNRQGFRFYPFNESGTVTIVKESENVWEVTCQVRSGTSNISLTLTAEAKYGQKPVSAAETYSISVTVL